MTMKCGAVAAIAVTTSTTVATAVGKPIQRLPENARQTFRSFISLYMQIHM